MSKHAHADLINKWLDDTSIPVESYYAVNDSWKPNGIWNVIDDIKGSSMYRLKPGDPYAELKQAQADGKRIVWLDAEGDWLDVDESTKWKFNYPPDRYDIIPYDQTEQISKFTNKFGIVVLKLTRSEITGKLTAEVI
jgi:hypothetical protein